MNLHKPIIINIALLFLLTISIFFLGSNLTYSVINYNQSSYSNPDNFDYSKVYSKEESLNNILLAEQCIKEMNNSNLTTFFVSDLLLESKRYYIGTSLANLEYDISQEVNQEISNYLISLRQIYFSTQTYELKEQNFTLSFYFSSITCSAKDNAFYLLDSLSIEEDNLNNLLRSPSYNQEPIDLGSSLDIFQNAKEAFYSERYEESNKKLEDFQVEYSRSMLEYKRKQGLLFSTRNFFEKFWIHSLLTLVLIGLITPFGITRYRINNASKKLESHKLEIKSIKKLIIEAQKDCFKYGKISEDTYKSRESFYKKRMNEIKEEIPVLQSIIKKSKKK